MLILGVRRKQIVKDMSAYIIFGCFILITNYDEHNCCCNSHLSSPYVQQSIRLSPLTPSVPLHLKSLTKLLLPLSIG